MFPFVPACSCLCSPVLVRVSFSDMIMQAYLVLGVFLPVCVCACLCICPALPIFFPMYDIINLCVTLSGCVWVFYLRENACWGSFSLVARGFVSNPCADILFSVRCSILATPLSLLLSISFAGVTPLLFPGVYDEDPVEAVVTPRVEYVSPPRPVIRHVGGRSLAAAVRTGQVRHPFPLLYRVSLFLLHFPLHPFCPIPLC